MEKERKIKTISFFALMLAIFQLTVAFSAFSSVLTIKATATVKPVNTFKVVFSSKIDAVEEKEIVPTTNSNQITAKNGKINNLSNPTITNLIANFTEPNQKVTYEFYVYNAGQFDAYLNSIVFNNNSESNTGSYKVCTAGEGTTTALVNKACENIKITVTLGNVVTNNTTSAITGELLSAKQGKPVKVVIEYENGGARADGPFKVSFGDIILNYSSVDSEAEIEDPLPPIQEPEEEPKLFKLTNDVNNNGEPDIGDEVTLKTEKFYVVENHENASEGTISLLSKYNLNVGPSQYPNENTKGLQDPNARGVNATGSTEGFDLSTGRYYGSMEYSTSKYWTSFNFDTNGVVIYNSGSLLYNYVVAYETSLKIMGATDIMAILPSYNQLVKMGCATIANGGACPSNKSWLYETSYWTGTAGSGDYMIGVFRSGSVGHSSYNVEKILGIRPLIIVSENDVG